MNIEDIEDFEKIKELDILPPGVSISTRRVLDPELSIAFDGENNCLSLGAVLYSRSGAKKLKACSLQHNWVSDDGTLWPLPNDIANEIKNLLQNADPSHLILPDVLRLQRDCEGLIDLVVESSVFQAANSESSKLSGDLIVNGLNASLYSYQSQGVAWMRETLRRTGGLILADEMGLGKTIQIISLFLLDPPPIKRPALILCPTTLIANWCQEIQRFAPSLEFSVHRGPYRTGSYLELMKEQIVITTYDTLVNDISCMSGVQWSYLICDEAQALRNPDSQRRIAATRLNTEKVIPVTGTPVETKLLDLWSLSDLAIPGLLNDKEKFLENFPENKDSAKRLAEITNPIVLKRQVKLVKEDLPERIDISFPIELGELSNEYENIRSETIRNYGRAGALVATGQLSLYCAHPWLQSHRFDDEGILEKSSVVESPEVDLLTPKMEVTVRLIREAFHNNRKVLIFANYNNCGELIRRSLDLDDDYYWGAINGSTPQPDRQSIVEDFSEYNGNGALVLNPRAAGAGLNITAATVVIHYTQVWNPALEAQASARAHRIGQEEPVTIYHLFYKDTVEEVMCDRCEIRRNLADTAVPHSGRDEEDLAKALEASPQSD
ncbi:DEAD/DEAH box helicase [Verrucomicrobia bacterium]|nr:DEAD/DEAH box helicase [Verrucomicrobiota bacterium]